MRGRSKAILLVVVGVAAIVVLYAVQIWIADLTAAGGPHVVYGAIMVAAGALQSLALFGFYRVLSACDVPINHWIAGSVIAMVLLSVVNAANTDIDASAYIGRAKLAAWHDAYRPPPVSFHGQGFDIINVQWGPQLPANVYGPLWLLIDRLVVRHIPTYAAALLSLRLCNVAILLGMLAALGALRQPRGIIAVIALNPMVYFYYVVQAHNDLLAVALVVAGMAIAQRRPLLGALAASTAGLVKILFVALATFAYAGRRDLRFSLLAFGLSAGLVLLISALFGGSDYFAAMYTMGIKQIAARADTAHLTSIVLHVIAAGIAVVAFLWAFVGGRFGAPATYSYAAISTIIYPWYLGWCTPYALRVSTFTAMFFISLPALGHLIDPHFPLFARHSFAVVDLCLVALILWAVLDRALRTSDLRHAST